MLEVRQNKVSHTWERSQENNFKIATWYTCDKQLFFFSTLNYLPSDDLKITLHNKHCMNRKSTEVHGGNCRVEPTRNTWLRVNQEMLENTTLAWDRPYTAAASALMPPIPNKVWVASGYGRIDSVLVVKCQWGFLNRIQSTEHLQDWAISPQPYYTLYIVNAFGHKQHFRWTHSVCKAARTLPHFALSPAPLWIWWIKPEVKLIQIRQILLKCLLNSDPGHQREHWTRAVQEDFLV